MGCVYMHVFVLTFVYVLQSCQRILEEMFVVLPGVISFTFNMARRRCTVTNLFVLGINFIMQTYLSVCLSVCTSVV